MAEFVLILLRTHIQAKLLKIEDEDKYLTLVPVVGTLQECASDPTYRAVIRQAGMVQARLLF